MQQIKLTIEMILIQAPKRKYSSSSKKAMLRKKTKIKIFDKLKLLNFFYDYKKYQSANYNLKKY